MQYPIYEYLIFILNSYVFFGISVFVILLIVFSLLFRRAGFYFALITTVILLVAKAILSLTEINLVLNLTKKYLIQNGESSVGVFYEIKFSGTVINDVRLDDYYIIFKTKDGRIIDSKVLETDLSYQQRKLFVKQPLIYLRLDPNIFVLTN